MARPAPPEETSPAHLVATMVGIVGILLLGSLAWSAVGALFLALGDAAASLSPRPSPTRLPTAAVAALTTSTPLPPAVTPTALLPTETPEPTATPTIAPTAAPTRAATTPTAAPTGRAPWVLLPAPPPNTRVPPGPVTIEARGRGDAPITAIRLELDGAPLPVSLEQRGEATWRGSASTQVGAGQHAVRATVVDEAGRTGSFRWSFEAGP